MEVAVGQQSGARNLPTVVDILAICHDQVGAGRNKRIQVDHGTTGLPQEPVKLILVAIKDVPTT